MASSTTVTIFESSRKREPFRIKGDEPNDGRRETADSGRSKLRNQRRIEFLRTTTSIWAAPITYMLDGTQYVMIPSGTTLFAFALPEE